MRLIDVDKLELKRMNTDGLAPNKWSACIGWNSAIGVLEQAPTVDAVEVVRCKDCKYYAPLIAGEEICFCNLREMTTYDDDFCSRGKRRKKDDDR